MTISVNLPIPLRQRYKLRGIGGFTEAVIQRERDRETQSKKHREGIQVYAHAFVY